jgi:hypothetical protein
MPPLPRSWLNATPPPLREVYAIGGFDGRELLASGEVFDADAGAGAGEWRSIPAMPGADQPPAPAARRRAAAAAPPLTRPASM